MMQYPNLNVPMGMSQSPLTPAKARLSDQQKKDNHISSEKKRREAIRSGFDKLSTLVPGMEGQARSEAIVLGATVTFMQDQIARRDTVIQLAMNAGWTRQEIDDVYSNYEMELRAQEQRAEAASMGHLPGQFAGQGQFQNTYAPMQQQMQPGQQAQVQQPPMQPMQPMGQPQPTPAQPQPTPEGRARSKSKSKSPAHHPEQDDGE